MLSKGRNVAVSITPPDANRPILNDDGTMEQSFRSWANNLTRQAIIIGTGSPEGVINSLPGAEYMDDTGVAGAIKYIKRDADIAGDTTQGWILI
jgi:hypothetical protein